MKKWIGITYLILLVSSIVYQSFNDFHPSLPDGYKSTELSSVPSEQNKKVTLAYREFGNIAEQPTLILIHGSPIASTTFNPLINELQNDYHLLVPDLPGFSPSTLEIPNYSIKAHAEYLQEWAIKLNLSSFHLLGYSMGSGVAQEWTHQHPDQVKTLTLLSGIGVQEHELLGDYYINHSLHAVQLGLLHLTDWLIPHFGLLDRTPLNLHYARNFYDTDQRPLRKYLEQIHQPVHIIHGKNDSLVPISAAEEHYRIIPQSQLSLLDGGHLVLMNQVQLVADSIKTFLSNYQQGDYKTRSGASQERIESAKQDIPLSEQRKIKGVALITFILLIALSTFGSEDLTCIGTGILCAKGILSIWSGVLACTLGIFVGDILLYYAGKYFGANALHKAPLKWMLSPQTVEAQKHWFNKKGPALIFFSRFIPGTRLPTYFAAGLLKLPLRKFVLYFLLAAMIWTPVIIGGAYYSGEWMFQLLAKYESYSIWILLGFIITIWTIIKLGVPLLSFKGRHLLYSSWLRFYRWEFWPRWKFYPPVVCWILFLAIRYRSIRIVGLANPGMPAGGVVNESKIEILTKLQASNRIGKFIPLFKKQSHQERIKLAQNFQETLSTPLPLILKPDKGERGADVQIIKSQEELECCLAGIQDSIIQEYIGGIEFGVFYIRMPNEATGRIFSITDKQYTKVTGDGKSTLEELILKDSRAICMAPTFLERYSDQLTSIPKDGESFKLVEIGTHSRGSLFLDACQLVTPALTQAIDIVSKTYPGFYFGRYDLKTPSIEAFQQGEFTILELNGLTSEPTHIYDPTSSLLGAYKTLFKQWHIAFEIGKQNQQNGHKFTSWKEAIALLKE